MEGQTGQNQYKNAQVRPKYQTGTIYGAINVARNKIYIITLQLSVFKSRTSFMR